MLVAMASLDELIEQGRKARAERRFAEARELYGQAAEVLRENHRQRYAHTIRHIADIFQDEANLAEAQPLYEEALEIYRSDFNTKVLDLANTVRPCALLQESLGARGRARELWQEARILYRSVRVEEGVRECEAHLAELDAIS
jgi:tetratricopeptide (TPR) repeat protein